MKVSSFAPILLLFLSIRLFPQDGPALSPALIEKHARASLQEYHDFLSIPNDANYPEQLEPNMQWVEQAFRKRGFQTRRLPTEGLELILAERPAPGANKTILFYVQVDGQPVDPSKWEQPTPFTPTLKERQADGSWKPLPWEQLADEKPDPDWRIFARSSADAKGPINMFLAALSAVDEAGIQARYNIKVIMDCEEELGSPHLPAAVEKHRDALKADWLLILDGPMHPSNRPALAFGARGIMDITLTTYGPRVPQHSGHYGNYAPNPALHLAQLLASMKDEQGRVTIPGFYDGINLGDEVRRILAQTPDDEAAIQKLIGIAEPDQVGRNLQEALQYPSLNIRGMASAWIGKEARTIIPATATAEIDVRLVKECDPERLAGLIRRHIEEQGYHLTDGAPTEEERMQYPRLASMKHSVSYQAFRTELDSPLGVWLDACLTKTWGAAPVKIRTMGGSIPISPFVNTLNIPAVAVPLANSDNNQHSPNENLRLGNYFDGVRTCVGVLSEGVRR